MDERTRTRRVVWIICLSVVVALIGCQQGAAGTATTESAGGETETDEATPADEPTIQPTLTEQELAMTLAEAGVSANGDWTPYIETIEGIPMALVPAGCFQMGSTEGDNDEQPVHEVCFEEPFWISVTEVSIEQFGGAYTGTGCVAVKDPAQPRNCVTWDEALAFAESKGMRLPTEAEWEFAARGPDALMFPWGNSFVAENAVTVESDPGGPAGVGSRTQGASWVGALDLSGNLYEWVSDRYGKYSADKLINPTGAESGGSRVLRGGVWYYEAEKARLSNRYANNPSSRDDLIGFRVARSYR